MKPQEIVATPKCDAFEVGADGVRYVLQPRRGMPDWVSFARQLERETISLRAELEEARRELSDANHWRARHSKDAEAATAQSAENWQKWKAAEAALRGERDKIGNEALEEAAKVLDDGCAHCDGRGFTVGPVCCGRTLPSGECCSNPDPERIQCPDACHQAAEAIRSLKSPAEGKG